MSLLKKIAEAGAEKLTRRRFMKATVLAAMAGVFPCPCLAALRGRVSSERKLAFFNTHTGESLEAVYWANGKYLSPAMTKIDHILRDDRTNEIKPIDIRLLDLLFAMAVKFESQQPFHIISGYRSRETNALLRQCGGGVAKNSLHMQGKAVDIRMPDVRLASLRQAAVNLKGGGVGYYPRSNFVHIDVGRIRYW